MVVRSCRTFPSNNWSGYLASRPAGVPRASLKSVDPDTRPFSIARVPAGRASAPARLDENSRRSVRRQPRHVYWRYVRGPSTVRDHIGGDGVTLGGHPQTALSTVRRSLADPIGIAARLFDLPQALEIAGPGPRERRRRCRHPIWSVKTLRRERRLARALSEWPRGVASRRRVVLQHARTRERRGLWLTARDRRPSFHRAQQFLGLLRTRVFTVTGRDRGWNGNNRFFGEVRTSSSSLTTVNCGAELLEGRRRGAANTFAQMGDVRDALMHMIGGGAAGATSSKRWVLSGRWPV